MEVRKGQGQGHCNKHFSFASDTLVATFPGSSPTLEVSSSRLEGKNESGNTTSRHRQPLGTQHTGSGCIRCLTVPGCPKLPNYHPLDCFCMDCGTFLND